MRSFYLACCAAGEKAKKPQRLSRLKADCYGTAEAVPSQFQIGVEAHPLELRRGRSPGLL